MAVILGLLELTCLGLHVPHIIWTLDSSLRRQLCLKELLKFAKYCLFRFAKGVTPLFNRSHVIFLVALRLLRYATKQLRSLGKVVAKQKQVKLNLQIHF